MRVWLKGKRIEQHRQQNLCASFKPLTRPTLDTLWLSFPASIHHRPTLIFACSLACSSTTLRYVLRLFYCGELMWRGTLGYRRSPLFKT